jgi:hypothetical protein
MDGSGALGPLFVPPWDDGGFGWIHGIPLLLAAAGIAIALLGLLRGRLPAPLAFAGLVALPAAAYAFGGLLLLEDSKRLEFCGSCHVMTPLVASLRADDGSLASKHFAAGAIPGAEACYVCHSGYGIWGTVGAKRAGVGHMIRTVTGRYDLPIEMHGSFDIRSCLGCHAASARFRAVEEHRPRDLQEELLSGATGCTGLCHDEAHPEEALAGGDGAAQP